MRDDPNHRELLDVARRRRERAERQRREGGRSFAQSLALIGVLGWIVLAPALVGIALGRWLDGRLHTGIFWSGAGIFLGLVLGCWMAWRRIHTS